MQTSWVCGTAGWERIKKVEEGAIVGLLVGSVFT